jgi:hypothetical protein
MNYVPGIIAVVVIIGGIWALNFMSPDMSGYTDDIISIFFQKTGIVMPHDKLGRMDNEPFTESDRERAASLSGQTYGSNEGVIRAIQSFSRGSITKRDFELLRQDRRRAMAAYPDVNQDDLFINGWVQVDFSARIPMDWCSSGNSNGTTGADGKDYLDGGCYMSFVSAKYPNRADTDTTKRVLAELKDVGRQKQLARLAKRGYFSSWWGTGGSASYHCYPDPLPSGEEADDLHIPGQCVVVFDERTKYVFPFVTAEWLNPPYSQEAVEKLAISKGVTASAYTPAPSKPWVMRDGSLARGQTCAPGRLCRSMWNSEKDDYDNTDIGPADPASWVLEVFLGMPMGYIPAPDNGEKHSDPAKPWYLAISYYGCPTQVSGGWSEAEAKAVLSKFTTGMTYPLDGRDFASANQGNLNEARATQIRPNGAAMLADRALPVAPAKMTDPSQVPYSPGMTLMPGQSTSISVSGNK